MKIVTKIGVVIGGYIAAILFAVVAVSLHIASTSGPDAQAASGMYAFGDMLFFFLVFGIAALVPTAIALFFLRPYRPFWYVLSGLGILIALSSIGGALLFEWDRHAPLPPALASWAMLSVLQILVAPLLALVFLACARLSAYRIPRLTFLAATIMEGIVTGYMAIVWFGPLLSPRH